MLAMRCRVFGMLLAFSALLACPAVCIGGALCDADCLAAPCQDSDHRSCGEHSCLCEGAPRPTNGNDAGAVAADLPAIILPVSLFSDSAYPIGLTLTDAGAYAATPGISPGICPLLI